MLPPSPTSYRPVEPIVRTFRAATMREALTAVREELGGDAVILHTRQIEPRGGLLRKVGSPEVEITAGLGVNIRGAGRANGPNRADTPTPTDPTSFTEQTPLPATRDSVLPASPFPTAPPPPPAIDDGFAQRLGSIEKMVADLSARARWSSPIEGFETFADRLRELGLPGDRIPAWIDSLRADLPGTDALDDRRRSEWLTARVRSLLDRSQRIQLAPDRRRTVALVGPTGVGKTTTIAKLAANFRLHEHLRMGLITVDTYRIAAVEQLRTYAEIIDLPLEVVTAPPEMRRASERLADRDLVLIDTAGRSPRDELRQQELKRLLAEADVDEVHLVLSLAASPDHLLETVRRFSPVGVTSLLLTKRDEVARCGHLLPVLEEFDLPLSYVTHGQDVPRDITSADVDRLTTAILGEPESSTLGEAA